MAEYKVGSVSTGPEMVTIDKDGDVITISVPGICCTNRSLDFNFSGNILTITDL